MTVWSRSLATVLACAMLAHGSAALSEPGASPDPPAPRLHTPPDSPVGRGTVDPERLFATFAGRFVLTGEFTYGCRVDCTAPIDPEGMALQVVPDPALAKRLPYWGYGKPKPIVIEIFNADLFVARAISEDQMRKLRSGELAFVTGRVVMEVEALRTGIECDSVWYGADLVRVLEAPVPKAVPPAGGGCGQAAPPGDSFPTSPPPRDARPARR